MSTNLKKTVSDRLPPAIFFVAILAYLVYAGILRLTHAGSTHLTLNWGIFVSLFLILATDVVKVTIETFSPKKLFVPKEDLSKVTVVIPCHNGGQKLEKTLKSLLKRFKKEQIIVSSNGSIDNTCEVARKYGVALIEREKAIGKVEAINIALSEVKTKYTLILDDDTLVEHAIFPTNALDLGYEAAAFRVLPVDENSLSKIQIHEYRKSMDVGRNYHNHSATVQNVSGAIGLFKTSELRRQVKLHTGEFSGEDLQRTLLVHLSEKSKGVVICESIVRTFAPRNVVELYNQRVLGWYPGFLANFDRYLKLLFKAHTPLRLRIEALYNTFFLAVLDPLRLLLLPVLLFTPEYLVFFYIVYVLLELIPYISMGMREPLWVVLVYPFYGFFNLITRILSSSVFLYRRLVVFFSSSEKYDDYKFVTFPTKVSGVVVSSLVIFLISFVTGLGLAGTTTYGNEVLYLPHTTLPQVASVSTSITALPDFTYTAKKGDSLWLISKVVVENYATENKLSNVEKEIDLFASRLANAKRGERIFPDVKYSFSREEVESVF